MSALSPTLPSIPLPQPEANGTRHLNSYDFVWQDPRTKEVTTYTYKLFKEVKEDDGTVKREQISLTEKQWEWAVKSTVMPALTQIAAVAARAGITAAEHFQVRTESTGETVISLDLPHAASIPIPLGKLENFCMEITGFRPKFVLPSRHTGYEQRLNRSIVDLKANYTLLDETMQFASKQLNKRYGYRATILVDDAQQKITTYNKSNKLTNLPPIPAGDTPLFIPLLLEGKEHYVLLYRLNDEWYYFDPTGNPPEDQLKQEIEAKIGIEINYISDEKLQNLRVDAINCGAYVLKKIEEVIVSQLPEETDDEIAGKNECRKRLETTIDQYRKDLANNLQSSIEFQQNIMQIIQETFPVISAEPNQPLPAAPKNHPQTFDASLVCQEETPVAALTKLPIGSKPLVLTFGQDDYYTEELKACSTLPDPENSNKNVITNITLMQSDADSHFIPLAPADRLSFSAFIIQPFQDINEIKAQFYNALLYAKENGHTHIIMPDYPLPDGLSREEQIKAHKAIAKMFKEVLSEHFSDQTWTISFASTLEVPYAVRIWEEAFPPKPAPAPSAPPAPPHPAPRLTSFPTPPGE